MAKELRKVELGTKAKLEIVARLHEDFYKVDKQGEVSSSKAH